MLCRYCEAIPERRTWTFAIRSQHQKDRELASLANFTGGSIPHCCPWISWQDVLYFCIFKIAQFILFDGSFCISPIKLYIKLMKLLILLVECAGFAPYASHAFILYPFSGCCDLGFLLHSFISCALCLEIVAFVFKQNMMKLTQIYLYIHMENFILNKAYAQLHYRNPVTTSSYDAAS